MSRIQQMLHAHPHPAAANGQEALACIEACLECTTTCTTCADACLAEKNAGELVGCVRLNLDCADVCAITARLLARPSHRDQPALRAQLQACAAICRACADECSRHAPHMEHCRICADSCHACVQACESMGGALVA